MFTNNYIEAFVMYQREYMNKDSEEIKAELDKFAHCHQYVVNNKKG